jgi:hypothetical protein
MKTTDVFRHLFTNTVELAFQRKYLLLVLFLLCRYAVYSTNGLWSEDFWEHSAVVRELMTHPLHPMHPQLLIDEKHAFFSPYSFLVATSGWLLHLDAISALAIFGLINFVLLSYGLKLFISTVDTNRSSTIAFYTLILMLLLWGSDSWQFSGFYSFEGLNSVLPYPSTFALGLSLLGLTLHASQLDRYALWKQILLIFICAFVLISHSLTAIFLIIGISCQALTIPKVSAVELSKVAITTILAFSLTLIWPYFSMLRLMTGEGNVYNFANTPMYLEVMGRIWPTILLVPIIVAQAFNKNNRSVSLILIFLIVIYAGGYLTKNYSYGRSIAFILLLSNIFLAQSIRNFECYLGKKNTALFIWQGLIIFTLFISVGIWLRENLSRILTIGNSVYIGREISSNITFKDLSFISNFTKQDEIVLADVEPSWIIPTLGGKVVATDHPLAFVPDWYLRKWQVMEFFNPETKAERRIEIYKKYEPNYLLIKKSAESNWMTITKQFSSDINGIPIFENEKYVLIRFK